MCRESTDSVRRTKDEYGCGRPTRLVKEESGTFLSLGLRLSPVHVSPGPTGPYLPRYIYPSRMSNVRRVPGTLGRKEGGCVTSLYVGNFYFSTELHLSNHHQYMIVK